MINHIIGPIYTGIYSTTIIFITFSIASIHLISQIYLPHVLNVVNVHNKRDQEIKKLFKIIMQTSLFFIFFVLMFGPHLKTLIFGSNYDNHHELFKSLIVLIPLFAIFLYQVRLNLIFNRYRDNLYYVLIMLIINVILNLYLIPLHGIDGSIYATYISLIITILFFIFNSRYKKYYFMN